ncbi:hypothetical protein EPJ67_09890 [Brachyspira aalborgi]|uniref:Uncharacterized protein n=1 Tax=Brachyspira aalborgi TaxID=29522 RepID=A0A5C8FY06_9SPIR|nr:hypothetical protein [Brachyspira aalborgi]TXJ54580.1 hypothetical protein EPJ67_09890 [Brachyspira aalborgi]
MVGMIIFVIVVITILYFITKGMGSKNTKNSENPNDNYVVGLASEEYINFRKEFNKLVKEFGNLSKEEQGNRLVNHVNKCYKRETPGIFEDIVIDIDYLIIKNLKMGKDIDVAKQVLLEVVDMDFKKYGISFVYLERKIKEYQEKGETEIVNIYKEMLLHFQELKLKLEERNRILNETANEVEYNIENNRFIETNIPLIADEGCFEIFDNIEVYEYRTRYGATNYEKVGEGKLYITNKKLYFIAEINAFPLVWLENIMDMENK